MKQRAFEAPSEEEKQAYFSILCQLEPKAAIVTAIMNHAVLSKSPTPHSSDPFSTPLLVTKCELKKPESFLLANKIVTPTGAATVHHGHVRLPSRSQ